MHLVHFVIACALLQFFSFGLLVGRARVKYQVPAPASTGHEMFERYFRVHYNTMEQLVVFVPSALLFGHYISPAGSAALGLVYLAGRFIYLRSYIKDPAKRGAGFGLSTLPILILMLGGLGAAGWETLTRITS